MNRHPIHTQRQIDAVRLIRSDNQRIISTNYPLALFSLRASSIKNPVWAVSNRSIAAVELPERLFRRIYTHEKRLHGFEFQCFAILRQGASKHLFKKFFKLFYAIKRVRLSLRLTVRLPYRQAVPASELLRSSTD